MDTIHGQDQYGIYNDNIHLPKKVSVKIEVIKVPT